MTANEDSQARGGLRRWFGLGKTRGADGEADEQASPAGEAAPQPADPRERRRQLTLDEITGFLLTHRLPVSVATLEIAHDIVTGANPIVGRLVAERIASREPVTLAWLEDVVIAQSRDNSGEQLHHLVMRLESSIAEFAATTTAARTATNDYNSALEAHVGDLGAAGSANEVIVQLATLARDMISRTRDIERELSRSERETRALQKNLADARREAEMDHLTGLPNRRAFEAVLKQEFGDSREEGEALAVAFCDIDNFKRINDVHGHEAGDRILRTVAQSLAKISNDKCHVARHGGEEFVVLLRGKTAHEAMDILDNAREKLATRKFVNRATDLPFGRISFSAGVADAHSYETSGEALRAADEALFRAKSAGRNRVVVANCADGSGGDADPAEHEFT
ncbi:GGDEF domain-containing protein [Novosphingobium pentaromativorans]|uniref:diguanylate cyclase n=1 Tax=Novosphingobium pentaromativorans US6-1 TaxID=1088721 RepID=G6E9E5_9SPHN|nr:GGDEF domain-containing protein [Novosphingobium pentaromativorans]AIT81046.1 diguanylate cyclase [Novosphingobium pentaromativorans US6-1]EHJ62369.1 diguanylate cyclase [Novosphingobium pentaromativorans US6-1]